MALLDVAALESLWGKSTSAIEEVQSWVTNLLRHAVGVKVPDRLDVRKLRVAIRGQPAERAVLVGRVELAGLGD
jgi:hypothetical protein